MRKALLRIQKATKGVFLLLLLWGLGHTIFILVDGFSDEPISAPVVVVFGNQVHPDGQLSNRLRARLDKAVEVYQKGGCQSIFVSGGIGVEGQPEGTVMGNYLVKKGVPAAMIVVDDAGNTSQLTVENFYAHYGPAIDEIVVISQYYHISRARLAFRKAGYPLVKGAHADFAWEWRDIYSVFREFPAYYIYLFRSFNLSH